MNQSVFTKQEFVAGLERLGEADARKLLRGGALDGDEARWAIEWLAHGPKGRSAPEATPAPATAAPAAAPIPAVAAVANDFPFAIAS